MTDSCHCEAVQACPNKLFPFCLIASSVVQCIFVVVYLLHYLALLILNYGEDELSISNPLLKCDIVLWVRTLTPSICAWDVEIAERSVLRERYCKPKLNWPARNSRILP